MKTLALLASISLVGACGTPEVVVSEPEPVSLDGWGSETIVLPPEFAPTMPGGEEQLLFAPGMFDAAAEDYWSYAFVMRLESGALDAAYLDELFEAYFDGLLSSVGAARGEDLGDDPADVRVQRISEGHYEAQVHLIDVFVTMKAIDLLMTIDAAPAQAGGGLLEIQASPQEREHAVWRSLEAAVRSIEFSSH